MTLFLGKTLFIFGKSSKIRRFCINLLKTDIYQYFMLMMIIFTFFVLALRDPFSDPYQDANFILFIIEIVIYAVFFIEFLMKIIANGFLFNGWDSYLIFPLNILDFILLVFEPLYFLRIESFCFKVFRFLRFFQVGPYSRNLNLILKTAFLSLPNLIKLTSILIIIMTIFSVFGIKYLKGIMYECDDIIDENLLNLIKTKTDCLDYGGVWILTDLNFDSLGEAFLTLFFVSGTENWIPILYEMNCYFKKIFFLKISSLGFD